MHIGGPARGRFRLIDAPLCNASGKDCFPSSVYLGKIHLSSLSFSLSPFPSLLSAPSYRLAFFWIPLRPRLSPLLLFVMGPNRSNRANWLSKSAYLTRNALRYLPIPPFMCFIADVTTNRRSVVFFIISAYREGKGEGWNDKVGKKKKKKEERKSMKKEGTLLPIPHSILGGFLYLSVLKIQKDFAVMRSKIH